jgi:ADP-ribose pyrophosphatase
MKNPWTTLDEKKVYENPWIRVSHHEVLTPGHSRGIYGVVHFKNLAVGVIPLDKEKNTWLVGQYRYTLEQYSWEIPEGGCPLGTSPLEAAQRELMEETGIKAENWKGILNLHTSNSVTDEAGTAYVATGLSFGLSQPEDTEELAVKKLPFEEVFQMVMSGQITDSLSIAAILKVKILLDQNQIDL